MSPSKANTFIKKDLNDSEKEEISNDEFKKRQERSMKLKKRCITAE
jgi:hypothetical protein